MKQKTNILLFPYIQWSLVELCEYWYKRGYTVGNTAHNNLCLLEVIE